MFVGEPFHTLPLAADVDYKSFALFVNVTDSSRWVNASSPKWEHNHMVRPLPCARPPPARWPVRPTCVPCCWPVLAPRLRASRCPALRAARVAPLACCLSVLLRAPLSR